MHVIHFERNPSIAAIKKGLCDLTGLALFFDEQFDDWLEVQHPIRPKAKIEIDWIDRENRKCVRVSSETPNWNYIEVSALHFLKQLGGTPEHEYKFPVWAGKKWANAYPRNSVLKLKAWWGRALPE